VDRSISCSHRTIDFYNEKLDKFLSYLDQIGISNLNQLDHGVVNGYFHFATKQGQSAANSHCVGRAVKAFLHWAADEELVSPAIVARMKLPKPPKKVICPFSVDDIQRLLDAAKQGKQPARDTAVLLILFDTGIWTQELCNPEIMLRLYRRNK